MGLTRYKELAKIFLAKSSEAYSPWGCKRVGHNLVSKQQRINKGAKQWKEYHFSD